MDGRDDQATDARLSIAASQGDDEAFAVLYERYAPRIGAYLSRLLDDEHLAQDLTHEVFVSALRRLRTDRPPIAFGPWLYRIARNASIDVHRRSQIVRQVPLDGAEEERPAISRASAPEAAAEVRQWLEQLRDVLGGLSETHRTVLVLRELEGLSNNEIAERLGVSRPAVEGLLFRARAKLRREYDDLASGRRCDLVQAALDRAQDGDRLAPRDAQLASRHIRACAQCRRHAWQAGLAAFLSDDGAPTRRRALLPVPLAVAAFVHRLGAKLQGVAEAPAALTAPWGRAAAGLSVLAIAGGAASVPQVRGALPLVRGHAAARSAAARAATPLASPTAAPTTLIASAGPVVVAAAPAPERAPSAPRPAVAATPASPTAAPTSLPAAGPAPSSRSEEQAAPASAAPVPATPLPPSTRTSPTPRDLATVAVAGHAVHHAVHRAVHHVIRHAAAPVAPATQPAQAAAGGVLTEATETAQAVVDAATGTGAAQPAQSDPPAQPVADAVAGAVTNAAPPVPAPAPAPAPVPTTPPAPATPQLPAAPAPQPPALPDPTAAPTPAAPPPTPPPGAGTLADRRGAEGLR